MLSRSTFVRSGIAGAAVAPSLLRRGAAQPAAPNVRVILFPGVSNLPLWCAIARGFFARENVTVSLTPTPGSIYMFQHLSAGDFDLAHASIDNGIAYDEGQGEAPLANPADFAAVIGGDNGMLRLVARPEIKSYADLRGKTLSVDSFTTGFAFVLRRMLEINGLHEGDYKLDPVGGTYLRYQALTSKDVHAATLLTPPFDLQARAQGFRILDNAIDVIKRYQGFAGTARRSWIAANGDLLLRYLRAYTNALGWLYDPANKAATIALITENAKLSPELATQVYGVAIDPQNGLAPKAAIDLEGVRTVLALRSAYGIPRKTLSEPSKYIDDRAYRRAVV